MERNIGIYNRILIMLCVTGSILILILLMLYFIKDKQEKIMLDESQVQFGKEVNSLLTLKTATLRQVVFDYTFWDDFVDNLNTFDSTWYFNNIATILKSFRIDYACVYDTNFKLIYEASSDGVAPNGIIDASAVFKLNETRFLSFFQATNNGLMEISGASVHNDTDQTHMLTKPHGYLFLARRWDKDYIAELVNLSGAEIRILQPTDSIKSVDEHTIAVVHVLQGWKGENIAKLHFYRNSYAYKLYHRMSLFILFIIIFSFLAVFLIFHFSTRKWLNRPLKLVMSILKSDDPVLIEKLKQSQGEFRNIGFLFSDYINQKHELKLAKDKAEESDRLKSAFLANMSHEIRTPMNGILGFAEMLREPGLTEEKQKRYVGIIEKSGTRLLNIINDLIDISKIEAGQMNVLHSDTNINDQVEFIYTFFRPEVERKGMTISFKNGLTGKAACIYTDREKLYAILTNLVKNAIKYSNEGSIEFGYSVETHCNASQTQNILVETHCNASQTHGHTVETHGNASLQFYVKDTGIGIPTDRQEAIFERFIQADIEDSMALQGAGLGLAITKAYIEMLGGKIWVESEEGKGSAFYFTIPYTHCVEKEPVIAKEIPAAAAKVEIRKKLKILIAEDDETSEILIITGVKKYSREIIKVKNGIEAVEICRNNPDIDLVLMDMQMPKMNGFDATMQIRQFNKSVVIIAQTAYALYGDKDKALAAGCNDYISKPIKMNELLELIDKYFPKEAS